MRSAVAKADRQTISLGKAGTVAGFFRRSVGALALDDRRPPRARGRIADGGVPVPTRSEIVFRAGSLTFR